MSDLQQLVAEIDRLVESAEEPIQNDASRRQFIRKMVELWPTLRAALSAREEAAKLEAEITALTARMGDTTRRYHDLILAVGKTYPGETRHKTALRYIRKAEEPTVDDLRAASQERKEPR